MRNRKLNNVKKYIIVFLFCGLFFLIPLFMMLGAKSYKDWAELDFDSNLENIYVSNAQIDLSGPYYTESDGSDLIKELYYVQVTDEFVMPLIFVEEDAVDAARQYVESKKKFETGEITKEELNAHRLIGEGKIYNVTEYENIAELENLLLSEDDTKMLKIMPYSMQVSIQGSNIYIILTFVILFSFCIISAIVCLLRATTSCGERMIIQYQRQKGNGELIKAQIDSFFKTKELTDGVWISNDYIAGIYNTTTIFRELDDLIWIYPVYMNAHTLNAGAAFALYLSKSPAYFKLYFKDRKCYTIQLSKATDVDVILSYINEIRPNVVTIYTPELEENYQRKECPFEE